MDIDILENPRLKVTANTDGLVITSLSQNFNTAPLSVTIPWEKIADIEEFLFDAEEWE